MAKLFSTSVKLRRYKSKNGNQVFIRIRTKSGVDIEIPVYDYIDYEKYPISVKKENWSKGLVTGGNYHIPVRELNFLIQKVEYYVKDAVRELQDKNLPVTRENVLKLTYINEDNARGNDRKIASGEIITNEDGGAFASEDEFKEFITESSDPGFNELKKSMGIYKKTLIMDYWDDFIKDFAPNSYNSTKHAVMEYIGKTGENCKVYEYSAEWIQRFFKYLIDEGYSYRSDGKNRRPYKIPTVNKYAKHLKAFGDYLFAELKVLDNQDYKRFTLRREKSKQSLIKYKAQSYVNAHALYKRELDWFYAFKFENKQLELVRDMFILQVWLGGLREKDFYDLKDENFHKDSSGIKVWFKQRKTNDTAISSINQNYIEPIFNQYENIFKEFFEVHQYNKLLKIAAKEAGLNRKLLIVHEQANLNKPREEWVEINKKFSNKWARKCAVSVLAELDYPDDRIAKFTNHRDLGMIQYYKSVHKKDVESMLADVKPETVEKL